MSETAALGRTVFRDVCMGIVQTLHREPMRYMQLKNTLGKTGRIGTFAYHLGNLRRQGLIMREGGMYFLTFKGTQVYRLIRAAGTIAGIGIASCAKSGLAREVRV